MLGAAGLFAATVVAMILGRKWQAWGRWLFVAGSICILGAMASLITLFLRDQFEFSYVAGHSWKAIPAAYKIAAVWAGQQGSFLLWACTSAVFGLLTFARAGKYQRWYVLTFAVFLGALAGILAYETPFKIATGFIVGGQSFIPSDGAGLNPSLQNYWVIIHPPTIFTGFGSLTVLFAYAVSAMIVRDAKSWVAQVRPWALVSLSILGLGLVMGGLWAYETQGWGGFWAWDPVENVSFVPWLFTVAFVHGLIVQTTRSRWVGTNLLLGGLPFLLFVYGTFLTRSGFLSKFSVHSFAEMDHSALMILLVFLVSIAIAFVVLWAVRGRPLAKELETLKAPSGFHREKAYQIAMLLLTGLAAAIAIGMSVPFFVGLAGGAGKVVEEPLYHMVVVWFYVPIMLLMAITPFLGWNRRQDGSVLLRLFNVLAITLGLLGILLLWVKTSDFGAHSHIDPGIDFPFGMRVSRIDWIFVLAGITLFAALANLWRLGEMIPRSKLGVGGVLAHFGVCIALAGLILSRGLEQKAQIFVAQDSPGAGLGYMVSYDGLTSNPLEDRDNKLKFRIDSIAGKASQYIASPGFFYTFSDEGAPQPFTWPSIRHALTHDVYLSLSPPVITLWEQPKTFKVGQTVDDGVKVTYLGTEKHGATGQPGTWFGAKLEIVEHGETYTAEPKITIGEGASITPATPNFNAVFVGMDAASGDATIDLQYKHPIFPIELFYKPMTGLVWLGTGILFIGGLLSAFYRRRRVSGPPPDVENTDDAALPTP